ncbi:MAG: 4Fe-4S dicluster domain-containing protein [Promethearchaeota archaeon]
MTKSYEAENETFMGVPRIKIPWWPTIKYDKCNFCMECDKFCPHNVYEKIEDDTKKLIVKNQYNCVVFCRACLKACPLDALEFPEKRDITTLIKQIRSEQGGQ